MARPTERPDRFTNADIRIAARAPSALAALTAGPILEALAIQAPGGVRPAWREPLLRRIEAIVDGLAPALLPYLDVLFGIFGHSMGAVLAAATVAALR